MITTSSIVSRVSIIIQEIEKANDYDVIMAYTYNIKPVPLDKPIVAVSLKKCDVGNKKNIIDDSGEEKETYLRDVATVVGVDIYLPYNYNLHLGVQIFDEIAHALFNSEVFKISEATCEKAHYDTASQTILIHSNFTITETIVP